MKNILIFYSCLLLGAAVAKEAKEPKNNQRLCPLGYFYAGDDTPMKIRSMARGYVFTEEQSRSDIYSCYKMFPGNDYVSALRECREDNPDAYLVSIDNGDNEAQRIANTFFTDERKWNGSVSILTSAITFDTKSLMYKWLPLNKPFDLSLNTNMSIAQHGRESQCLIIEVLFLDKKEISWSMTPCNDKKAANVFMCEMRVQTVTYIQWFKSNWLNFCIMLLIILLVVSLCLSGCMYSNVRRGRRVVQQQLPNQTSTTDAPPSYEAYVNAQRVHEGLPPKNEASTQQAGAFERVRTRGREILTQITVFKRN